MAPRYTPHVITAVAISFALMGLSVSPIGAYEPGKSEPKSNSDTAQITVDLSNPSLIKALKSIQGFNEEQYAATITGKTCGDFAVTVNSPFFAPLADQKSLDTRRAENAKYSPFGGNILPPADGAYMIGAYQERVELKFENGQTRIEDESVNALLPGQNMLFVEYADSKEHGAAWKVPERALISEGIFAVPVVRNGKPNGRYFLVMPMRDASYDDIAQNAAAYGDYVVQYTTQILSAQPKPAAKKSAKPLLGDNPDDSIRNGGIEFYGDTLYIDTTQINKTLTSHNPTSIKRPMSVRGAQKVTIGDKNFVIALGTEITDGSNAFVFPLRAAVGAKEWIFQKENNKTPATAESVSVGVTNGDPTKYSGYVFIRNMNAKKVSR